MNLGPRQIAVLRHVRDFIAARGGAPTLAEIADALNVSKVTIFEHVATLRRNGAIRIHRRRGSKARSSRDLALTVAGETAIASIVAHCPHCGLALMPSTRVKEDSQNAVRSPAT